MTGNLRAAVLVLSLAFFGPYPCFASWEKTTVSKGGEFHGVCQSIRLDAVGHPHIVYIDESNPADRKVTHAFFDGIGWHQERVDTGVESVRTYCSLAIDSVGHLHVAYDIETPEQTLMYAYFDGTHWIVSQIGQGGSSISITVDAEDRPHLSHIYNSQYLEYVRHDGTNWVKETISSNALHFGSTSIALTSLGKAHISYSDFSLPRKLYYATNTSGVWTSTYVGDGRSSSLALDSSENPHIAYYSEGTLEMKYAHLTTLGWTAETFDTMGDGPSIGLDPYDRTHIIYAWRDPNIEYVDHAGHAYFDGTSWSYDLIDTAYSGYGSSLTLDNSGLPHVSYRREGKNGSGTVIYAFLLMPELTGDWTSITVREKKDKHVLTGLLQVTNAATGKSAKCNITYYLSDDNSYGGDVPIGKIGKVSSLKPGQGKSVKFKYTSDTPLSGKYLIAVIDSGNSVSEANESNNVVIGQIP